MRWSAGIAAPIPTKIVRIRLTIARCWLQTVAVFRTANSNAEKLNTNVNIEDILFETHLNRIFAYDIFCIFLYFYKCSWCSLEVHSRLRNGRPGSNCRLRRLYMQLWWMQFGRCSRTNAVASDGHTFTFSTYLKSFVCCSKLK